MPSSFAACRDAVDRARELPGDLGPLGVAEVEAVGERDRLAAGAGDVERRVHHGAPARRGTGRARRAAGRRARPRARACRRGAARRRRGPAGAPCASRRGGRTARTPSVFGSSFDGIGPAPATRRPRRELELVARRLVGQEPRRDLADELAVVQNARSIAVGRSTSPITVHGSSQRAQTASTSASRSGSTTATIRSCDSEIMISHGSRPGSRSGTRSRCTSTPAPPRGHLGERGGEPGGAAVLQAGDEVALDQVERHLDQRLAAERVADLHRRPLVVRALEVLAREHRGAADAVAAGERAVEDDQVAGAGRLRARSTRSAGSSPTHIAFTSGFAAYASSKTVSPPTVGTPVQLP